MIRTVIFFLLLSAQALAETRSAHPPYAWRDSSTLTATMGEPSSGKTTTFTQEFDDLRDCEQQIREWRADLRQNLIEAHCKRWIKIAPTD